MKNAYIRAIILPNRHQVAAYPTAATTQDACQDIENAALAEKRLHKLYNRRAAADSTFPGMAADEMSPMLKIRWAMRLSHAPSAAYQTGIGTCNMRCSYCFYADVTKAERFLGGFMGGGRSSARSARIQLCRALARYFCLSGRPTLVGLD